MPKFYSVADFATWWNDVQEIRSRDQPSHPDAQLMWNLVANAGFQDLNGHQWVALSPREKECLVEQARSMDLLGFENEDAFGRWWDKLPVSDFELKIDLAIGAGCEYSLSLLWNYLAPEERKLLTAQARQRCLLAPK